MGYAKFALMFCIPIEMVRDLRTNVETGNSQAVLDGDLDAFVEASAALTNTHPELVAKSDLAAGSVLTTLFCQHLHLWPFCSLPAAHKRRRKPAAVRAGILKGGLRAPLNIA